MRPLSPARLLAITAMGFALSMVINTVDPALYTHKIRQLVPDRPNTALGFTTFAALIVAVVTQPIVGVLSDRLRSPWGRRLPFLAAGTLMVILCLFAVAVAGDVTLLVAAMLLLSFSTNTVQGPFQALIPDHVPEAQRGRASGLKGLSDILALVAGAFAAGRLLSLYPQWGSGAVLATVALPSLVFILALGLTAWGAREGPDAGAGAPRQTLGEALALAFFVDFRAHPSFVWWFLNRLLFWSAFIALRAFLVNFMIDVAGLTEAGAQSTVGTVTVVLGVTLAVVSFPAGWLADRIGRKPLAIAAGPISAAGVGVLLIGRDLPLIIAAGAVVGFGAGIFITSSWALITDIVPRDEAARYLGVANIATAGGSALARFLGAVLIDSLNLASGTRSAGYLALCGIAAAFFLLGTLAILRMPSARPARME